MFESVIKCIASEMAIEIDNGVLRAVQKHGFDVDKEELAKALQYDRNQYDKGYADAMEDLDILISEFLVPMEIENVCEELHEWDMDEEDETWCGRNCGVTNDGKCPAMNCYKEWIKMKKAGADNG